MEDNKWAVKYKSTLPKGSSQKGTTEHESKKKTALYVGQPQNIFCRGARFDGVSKLQIHPPPPGCPPNEYQKMLMDKEGDIFFTPSHNRIKDPGKFPIKSNNKITPNVTVVADIQMADPTRKTSPRSTESTSETT